MKSLLILALALASTNASAALRDPGNYTGECHGISVMAEYENGKEIQRFPSKFRYDVAITVEGEGNVRIETTTTTLYGEHGPHGAKSTSQSKVEEISPNLIRRTHLGLGRFCDYQVDAGGAEEALSCTDKDGKKTPAASRSYRYLGWGGVEYSGQLDAVSASPKEGEDFSGWALAYSNLYCSTRPVSK